MESRLGILTRSIEHQADLHPFGRLLARVHLRDLLAMRLQLEDTWTRYPGLDSERIVRPVFITGMPRSGSTFLHELLAQDPANRAPLVWEVMSPLPASRKRRIWRATMFLWCFRQLAPEADRVYPLRAATPQECVAIHSYTLLSREFTTTFRIPAYTAFLDLADLAPAYAWQKKFLQYLQWRQLPRQWVLKAPDHVFSLEALLRVFPDAIIVQTHRNPLEVLESSSRLIEVVQRAFAHPQKRSEIGAHEARSLADGMERITRFREGHPELAGRFLDVHYDELIADPADIVRRLYRQLDLPLTYAILERVRGLAANRSRYGRRLLRPSLGDLGIDAGVEVRRFANYCARFGVRQV